ncbi:MAG: polymer-forming cytoskeletal protein [Myxococcota bacterium]|nr:polymer-forming cytoskeletal protein [Myxococcota bacterium]
MATIGKSIIFKGELSGSEDLEVNGTVEGDVKLPDNTLIVGQSGHVKASIAAKSILIVGRVTGDVTATERIEIEASGIVEGDLRAPRLLVKEGAVMNGSVEMTGASKSLDGDKSSAARSDSGSSASTTSTTSTTSTSSTSTSSTAAPRSQASAD